jgi:hypothetical protein
MKLKTGFFSGSALSCLRWLLVPAHKATGEDILASKLLNYF